MVLVEFNRSRFGSESLLTFEKPYYRVVIDAKDHTQIYRSDINSWTPSTPLATVKYPSNPYGTTYIGLSGSKAVTSATLTKAMTIDKTGLYRVILRCLMVQSKASPYNQWLTINIDGLQIGDGINCYSTWGCERYVDLGVHPISSGSRAFTINLLNKDTWVHEILLYKINRFSSDANRAKERLDVKSIQSTQNTVSELNTAELNLFMQDDFFVPEKNSNSRMVFDLTDSMTLFVGNNRKTARALFGGYIIGYDLKDDNGEVTLNHIDTLMDLYRRPIYRNYYIGVKPSEGVKKASFQFSSFFEAVRHLCTTAPYPIVPSGITYKYGFIKNFGNYPDFESVATSGFFKQWDKRNGYPAPGMKLTYDSIPLRCASQTFSGYATIYSPEDSLEEGPFNANTYNMLSFNYFSNPKSSDTSKNMQFNVRVNMFKTGQTPSEALDYHIMFTGKSGQSNVIGTVPDRYSGKWEAFKFDLKEAFDRYASSSNYYINKIDLVDEITGAQVNNRMSSSIWIDNPMAYTTDTNLKFSSEQDSVYPYDLLKDACEKAGYAAYMSYGPERRKDRLMLAPLQNEPSSELISDEVNVLRIYNKKYTPKENIANQVLRYWNDKDTTATAYIEDLESLRRYGPFENFENLNDVTSLVDANIEARKHLENNSGGLVTFSMDIKGTTLLNPSQYVVGSIPSNFLSGNHAIASIIHNINPERDQFLTQIDLGAPSRRFRFILMNIKRQLRSALALESRSQYSWKSMNRLGLASPGGFIKTY